jgi:hypothetical protein
MIRARLLVWMIAVAALLAPPAMANHALAPVDQAATVDCPGHAAPPGRCPDHDTAKHAAGACCPSMSGAGALLPAAAANGGAASSHAVPQVHSPALVGRLFAQDPPPPRV